jgi:hypothetical protein
MKFLAILKDSLRETFDAKLIYVTLFLSGGLCFLLGTLTYKPVGVKDWLEFLFHFQNLNFHAQMQSHPETQGADIHLDLKNFERTDDRGDPWLGDYKFDVVLVVHLPQEDVADENQRTFIRQAKARALGMLSEQQVAAELRGLFKKVSVKKVDQDNLDQTVLHVESEGTVASTRQSWFHEPSLFFGTLTIPFPVVTLSGWVNLFGSTVVGYFGSLFNLFIGIIITGFFLPNMLSKGTIDLLLAKPISRIALFLYKFSGGLIFMFINTAVIMTGVWLSIGLQSGLWLPSFLLCIPVYTFQFAIVYVVSSFFSVFTRSAVVSILAALMFCCFLIAFGWFHYAFVQRPREVSPDGAQKWAVLIVDGIHTVLPRFQDLTWAASKQIEADLARPTAPATPQQEEDFQHKLEALDKRYAGYGWKEGLIGSSIFIVVVLTASCWWFATKDY